mgnify:CR=1 FL=1
MIAESGASPASAASFMKRSVDAVVSGLVLNFVPDPVRAVREMARAFAGHVKLIVIRQVGSDDDVPGGQRRERTLHDPEHRTFRASVARAEAGHRQRVQHRDPTGEPSGDPAHSFVLVNGDVGVGAGVVLAAQRGERISHSRAAA